MAMNGNTLGTAIKAAAQAVAVPEGGADDDYCEDVWQAIANAIVDHIQNNAVVSTNVAVTSVSGVTTGPSASGPGTGTGTGTIT